MSLDFMSRFSQRQVTIDRADAKIKTLNAAITGFSLLPPAQGRRHRSRVVAPHRVAAA
jgi:hypothetical protein